MFAVSSVALVMIFIITIFQFTNFYKTSELKVIVTYFGVLIRYLFFGINKFWKKFKCKKRVKNM